MVEDLVSEILARLPVKSLARFKCVHSSWKHLFTTPTFISSHVRKHKEVERVMLFGQIETHDRIESIMKLLSDDGLVFNDVECPFPNPSQVTGVSVLGFCNNIFCLCVAYSDNRSFSILWNPATKEVKVIPPPPHAPSHEDDCNYDAIYYGFGVDPGGNFKLVNFIIYGHNKLNPPSVALYSLGTNDWTLIDDHAFPCHIAPDLGPLNPVFANGVCHWDTRYIPISRDILCFDFGNNRFHVLKPPPTPTEKRAYLLCQEIDDSLAYASHHHPETDGNVEMVEILILKQDGWTKKYTIGPVGISGFAILLVWKGGAECIGGDFCFDYDGELVSVNSVGQILCHFPLVRYRTNYLEAFKYIETIAPLSL